MPKLFYAPGACSLSTHIALVESGLQFETERVDLKTKRTSSGDDFWRINPKGYVPALETDVGDILTEASVILEWIADQKPEAHLAPPLATMGRYRVAEWLSFLTTEIHKRYAPFFDDTVTAPVLAFARTRLEKRYAWLEQVLSDRDYLVNEFTIADAYAYVMFRWAPSHGFELGPASRRYLDRLSRRESVRTALTDEGLAQAA